SAFFISDGTGITAVALGRSLLTQFEDIELNRVTLPYIDSEPKANSAVAQINEASKESGIRPLVICTLANESLRQIINNSDAMILDVFSSFMPLLETELDSKSENRIGQSRSQARSSIAKERVNAVNFALENDDGATSKGYEQADIILTGVSRTGKTPTSLYLALQFGVLAANYPLTEDDLDETRLPRLLKLHRHKLFGLSLEPELLSAIRSERRPDSPYASLRQCLRDVQNAEAMFNLNRIPYLDASSLSIEEISTRIIAEAGLRRRFK
ncbi:MAG: kinase/pyrophosphorylase, partial [Motiliproteus sp.]|nr:kinase/pyrophosphorylase [Motiliproteus sp.]